MMIMKIDYHLKGKIKRQPGFWGIFHVLVVKFY